MARFTNLSNELIIAIGSHIRKPAHSLNLVLVNRRTHGLILPLLYEHIVLHPNDYPDRTDSKYQRLNPCWMVQFCDNPAVEIGLRSVHTLEIGQDSLCKDFHSHHLKYILSRTTSLKRFCLLAGSFTYPTLPMVVFALDRVSTTLESLDLSSIYYNTPSEASGWYDVPGLGHFTALKHLCIQSCCHYHDFWTGIEAPSLRTLLPVCLQQLEMHRQDDLCVACSEYLVRKVVDLMEEGLRTPRPLRSVTLCLFSEGGMEPGATELVQEMSDRLDLATAKLNQQGISMDAKVRLVGCARQALR